MFDLQSAPLDIAALSARLRADNAGAFCSFEGWVRNHHDGKPVSALEYSAHHALALAQGQAVLRQAAQRFAIINAMCVHRLGFLRVGELAVWVGVSAAHRDAAFTACRFIIDEIKREVPIWKLEHYQSGSTDWLHPLESAQGDGTTR
jgi:molybdopterin synthase catalytic subunit